MEEIVKKINEILELKGDEELSKLTVKLVKEIQGLLLNEREIAEKYGFHIYGDSGRGYIVIILGEK